MKILRGYKGYGPIILCEDTTQTEFPSVCIDHYAAVTLAFDHLIKNNYSKIGLVLGRMIGNSQQRLKAYPNQSKSISLSLERDWLIDGIYNITDGGEVFHIWNGLVEKPDDLLKQQRVSSYKRGNQERMFPEALVLLALIMTALP